MAAGLASEEVVRLDGDERDDTPLKGAPEVGTDRDPKNINVDVKVQFDDMFAEPRGGGRTDDRVWALSDKVFTVTSSWCYRILSFVLALPLAVCCAVNLACCSFWHVWCCMPCVRLSRMPVGALIAACQPLTRLVYGCCRRQHTAPDEKPAQA